MRRDNTAKQGLLTKVYGTHDGRDIHGRVQTRDTGKKNGRDNKAVRGGPKKMGPRF